MPTETTYGPWIDSPTYQRDYCPPDVVDPVTGEDDPLVAPADQVGGAWLTDCATGRASQRFEDMTFADKNMPRLTYIWRGTPPQIIDENGYQVENYLDGVDYFSYLNVAEAEVEALRIWRDTQAPYVGAGGLIEIDMNGEIVGDGLGLPTAPILYETRRDLLLRWQTENYFGLGGAFGYDAGHPHNVEQCDYDAIFADARLYTSYRARLYPSDSRRKFRAEGRIGLSDWPFLVSKWNTKGWTPWELPADEIPAGATGFEWSDVWADDRARIGTIVDEVYCKQMIDLSKRMRPGPGFNYNTGLVAFSPRPDIFTRADDEGLENALGPDGMPVQYDEPRQWAGPRYDTNYLAAYPYPTTATFPGGDGGSIKAYTARFDVDFTDESYESCLVYVRCDVDASDVPDPAPFTPPGARWSTGSVFQVNWQLRVKAQYRWRFDVVTPDPPRYNLTGSTGERRHGFWSA